jgi:hypothetical protein
MDEDVELLLWLPQKSTKIDTVFSILLIGKAILKGQRDGNARSTGNQAPRNIGCG